MLEKLSLSFPCRMASYHFLFSANEIIDRLTYKRPNPYDHSGSTNNIKLSGLRPNFNSDV